MIARIWHGYTNLTNADRYQDVLLTSVIPGIEAMGVPGLRGVEVLRQSRGNEVEFITIMRFESTDDVHLFVGDDITVAHVPAEARALLTRFDERATHFQVVRR